MLEPAPALVFGLTTLGIIHTVISLAAVVAGALAFFRYGAISWENALGKFYVTTTLIVCLTGFGIFQHGGFGRPHALGVVTLVTLGVIYAASKNGKLFGRLSGKALIVLYSLTFFFHIVPAITETATRLPLDAPLASTPDDPNIQMAVGICFVLFAAGVTLQVRRLRNPV